jgi:hypothetical protein
MSADSKPSAFQVWAPMGYEAFWPSLYSLNWGMRKADILGKIDGERVDTAKPTVFIFKWMGDLKTDMPWSELAKLTAPVLVLAMYDPWRDGHGRGYFANELQGHPEVENTKITFLPVMIRGGKLSDLAIPAEVEEWITDLASSNIKSARKTASASAHFSDSEIAAALRATGNDEVAAASWLKGKKKTWQ